MAKYRAGGGEGFSAAGTATLHAIDGYTGVPSMVDDRALEATRRKNPEAATAGQIAGTLAGFVGPKGKIVSEGLEEVAELGARKSVQSTSQRAVTESAEVAVKRALCFAAGTLVHASDGLKPIETLAPGDRVWSVSEHDVGEAGWRKVLEAACTGEQEIYEVSVSTPDGAAETYRTTKFHPFWTETGGAADDGGFVAAGTLRVGEQLRLSNGEPAYVTAVVATGVTEPVYNISVEGWKTYHIGTLGVWVHNECLDGLYARIIAAGSKMPREQFDKLAAYWDKGTFGSVADSIIYHANEKGFEDIGEYMRKGGSAMEQIKGRARGWTRSDVRVQNAGSPDEYYDFNWTGPNRQNVIIDSNGFMRSWGWNRR